LFKSLVTASVTLAFAISVPAFAKDDDQHSGHEQSATEGEQQPESKKVCRMQTETGSVMPKKVCRVVTKQSLKEEEREREQMLRNRSARGIGG
jgi:hypothetical protein